jgi:hypothetical protein
MGRELLQRKRPLYHSRACYLHLSGALRKMLFLMKKNFVQRTK